MMFFLLVETDNFNKSIIDPIARKYKVGKRLILNVSLNVLQDEGKSIQINQNKYAAEMPEIPVSPNRKSDIISSPNRNEKYKS